MNKEIKEYIKFLTECGKNFVLTPEDISNLYDLSSMITWQDYEGVFKPNKMDKWFKIFFKKLEEICLTEKKDYSKVIMKLNNSQRKKVEDDGSDVTQLETQNKPEEENRTEQRTGLVDNHADNSKIKLNNNNKKDMNEHSNLKTLDLEKPKNKAFRKKSIKLNRGFVLQR